MSGQTTVTGYIPLPGGAVAIYNSSGLVQYNHPDWLGSARLISTPGRIAYSLAFAPFGEAYAYTGSPWTQFTEAGNVWTVNDGGNQGGTLDDFTYRRYAPVQGRWISPDPAGLAAVDPTNPQSWNRYAYVANNPLSFVDPLGLQAPGPGQCSQGAGDPCGGGGGGGADGLGGDNFLAFMTYGYWPGDGGAFVITGMAFWNFGGQGNGPNGPGGPCGFAGSCGGGANDGASHPCAKMGKAPPPSYYAAQAIQQDPSNPEQDTSPVNMLIAAWEFNNVASRMGIQGVLGFGSLNAQAQGASPAYANYVYGVYMSAAGFSLDYAQSAGNLAAAMTSNYGPGGPPSGYNPNYPSTPNANVANIAQGYNDQQYGTLCTPTTIN